MSGAWSMCGLNHGDTVMYCRNRIMNEKEMSKL